MTDQLRIADIARLRGCTPAQIGTWRSQSAPGKRLAGNPFPAPDGLEGRSPLWNADRADELRAWEAAPAIVEARAELPEPQALEIGQQVFDSEADVILEWDGTGWVQVDPVQESAQARAEPAAPGSPAPVEPQRQRPLRFY